MGHRELLVFLRSVSFCPDECLIWTLDNTKNGYFPVFQVTNSYIISSAVWTLFICVLSLAVFLTSKNLTESESDLSKAMSSHLVESQTNKKGSVQSHRFHRHVSRRIFKTRGNFSPQP